MRFDCVYADAQDDGFLGVVLRQIPLESMGLDGAALRHVFGIEIENYPFPPVILEADGSAFLGFQREIGSFGAFSRRLGSGQETGGRKERRKNDGELHNAYNATKRLSHPPGS